MSSMTAPAEEAGFAAEIAAAASANEPILVQGRATKLGMMRPVQAARVLSTVNHRGITLYSPQELIIAARSGTPLAEIEAKLAEHGQYLIAEPPDYGELLGHAGESSDTENPASQTLGGVVATNLSGPRRVAWGAMRDHVMGARAVNGRAEIIHSGGRVLKNVTGLDLCKLLSGSHGTLGVITEITLKVLPAPEATGTLVITGLDAASGVAAISAALGSPYGVSGAAFLPADAASRVPALAAGGRSVAIARIEDFSASVAYRTDRLRSDLAGFGAADIVDDRTSRIIWRAVRDAVPLPAMRSDAIWRVSVRPSAGARVLEALSRQIDARGFLDWGGGLVWIAATAETRSHIAVERVARAAGGAWTLFRAPDALRAAVNVVPPEVEALAHITRRVKAAFDPRFLLNPGRLYAGL